MARGNRKNEDRRTYEVVLDNDFLVEPFILGSVTVSRVRGKEVLEFLFSDQALSDLLTHRVLPGVVVSRGNHYLQPGDLLYQLLLDSAPDRWGRVLLDKKARLTGKLEPGKTGTLLESDYLLNVSDRSRMGAIRFRNPVDGNFEGSHEIPVPPMARLAVLEKACRRLENDEEVDEWIRQLITPGSSLGGARPKANILDDEGQLCIAKFPSNKDTSNKGLLEKLANTMAGKCGIEMPQAQIRPLNPDIHLPPYHTYIARRFDRIHQSRRHFVSAMSLTHHSDRDAVASYLEMVEFIRKFGANPESDIKKLWQRIVFNIFISNGDDHLRNHGFILTENGWILSPAFDVNIGSGRPGDLHLMIDDADQRADFDLALTSSVLYGVNLHEAREYFQVIIQQMTDWPRMAESAGLKKEEIEITSEFIKLNDLMKFSQSGVAVQSRPVTGI